MSIRKKTTYENMTKIANIQNSKYYPMIFVDKLYARPNGKWEERYITGKYGNQDVYEAYIHQLQIQNGSVI